MALKVNEPRLLKHMATTRAWAGSTSDRQGFSMEHSKTTKTSSVFSMFLGTAKMPSSVFGVVPCVNRLRFLQTFWLHLSRKSVALCIACNSPATLSPPSASITLYRTQRRQPYAALRENCAVVCRARPPTPVAHLQPRPPVPPVYVRLAAERTYIRLAKGIPCLTAHPGSALRLASPNILSQPSAIEHCDC